MTAAAAPPRRYLALGDSYTIGEGVPVAGRWPEQLAAALRGHGVAIDAPQIVATTGWTTDELAAGLDAAAPQGPFALVTLLIGVNNQYRDRPLDTYRQQFEALLARAVGYAGHRTACVLVLSIPDWGVTPYARAQGRDAAATAQAIDRFNRVAADACAAQGVAFVDITGYSRTHGAEPAMLAADGLHPSARMYAGWTALTLREALRAVTCTARPSSDLPT